MATSNQAGTTVAQVPAHIMARIAARGGAKSALLESVVSGASFPKVSIRASRYRLIDEGVETVVGTELDVIFVAINPKVSKIFYDKAYSGDSDDRSPPACFSNDGVTPDASIADPVSGGCAKCPNNVLGSRTTPNGKPSKICGDIRHTAVVPSADPTKPYSLVIPVSAMKGLRLYFKELSQYGLVPEEVVTTLGFDDEASFPRITFKHKGYVPEKHLATLEAMGSSADTAQIIRLPGVTTPALAAPARPALKAVPTIAAPEVEAEDPALEEVVVDAPVEVAKPAPKAVAKPAPKAVAKPAPAPATKPAEADPHAALEKQLDDLFA